MEGWMDQEKARREGKKWGMQNRHCVVNYIANQSSPWALLMRACQTFPSTLSNPPTVCQRGWGYGANKQFIRLNVVVRTKGSGVENKRKPITSRKKKKWRSSSGESVCLLAKRAVWVKSRCAVVLLGGTEECASVTSDIHTCSHTLSHTVPMGGIRGWHGVTSNMWQLIITAKRQIYRGPQLLETHGSSLNVFWNRSPGHIRINTHRRNVSDTHSHLRP